MSWDSQLVKGGRGTSESWIVIEPVAHAINVLERLPHRDLLFCRPVTGRPHSTISANRHPIQETHLSETGLLVLDMAGLDDTTVYAFQDAIARTWAATVDRTTRAPGQPGARVRMYVDLRQPLTQASPQQMLIGGTQEAWSATTGGAADQA
ncbi:DUF6207 family protein [Streptomyces dioscori]|uniref:DUF6207 family protein n=1 Tax=Streptomyces dioscori TaxID=2109333 RepID=UPI001CECC5B0|nr:DUF6207 family protein [Streptomyces dioscori]